MEQDTHFTHGGTSFTGGPGYGSRYDDMLLCEQTLEVVLCDGCLDERKEDIDIVYQPRAERPEPTRTQWDPTRHKERYDGGEE
jgi:hypothetical protein